jgi:hypothetical protein
VSFGRKLAWPALHHPTILNVCPGKVGRNRSGHSIGINYNDDSEEDIQTLNPVTN